MGTCLDKLNKIKETKATIKQAIIDKGISVLDSDAFSTYPEKINQIVNTPTQPIVRNNCTKEFIECSFPLHTTYKVPDNVTKLGDNALLGCKNLEILDLNNVTTIGKDSCVLNDDLKKIIGLNVTFCDFETFCNNFNVEEINLPQLDLETLHYNNSNHFQNCYKLSKLIVKNIGPVTHPGCFENCYSLDIRKFDFSKITRIAEYTFALAINRPYEEIVKEPYTINLPSIEKLELGAFSGRKYLQNIVLGPNLSVIGNDVFTNCSSLESIHIGSSITEIYDDAFYGSSLKTITIDKPKNTILGAPWGATGAQVIWKKI